VQRALPQVNGLAGSVLAHQWWSRIITRSLPKALATRREPTRKLMETSSCTGEEGPLHNEEFEALFLLAFENPRRARLGPQHQIRQDCRWVNGVGHLGLVLARLAMERTLASTPMALATSAWPVSILLATIYGQTTGPAVETPRKASMARSPICVPSASGPMVWTVSPSASPSLTS
jgi:hypothetical protein